MSLVPRQDMPPLGGYGPIPFHRIPAKRLFSPVYWFGIAAFTTAGGYYLWMLNDRDNKREEIELRSARLVTSIVLQAEQDRELLRLMRRNREYEAKLMANVEGWEVGTYYGEPVFKTLDKNEFFDYPFSEKIMHTDHKEITRIVEYSQWF